MYGTLPLSSLIRYELVPCLIFESITTILISFYFHVPFHPPTPESETFDLAGNSLSTIQSTISSAFAEPLDLTNEMIRITFITGAGKLGRQRYDEGAAKTLTSTLRDLGYVEDRGASCVVECAGSFKSQHDTGKNLKTIVVFPKINDASSLGKKMDGMGLGDGDGDGVGGGHGEEAILTPGSVEEMIAMASMVTFEKMLSSKCPTWSQKKACNNMIGLIKDVVTSLDDKLFKGTPLSETEQDFYDSCDLSVLEQKEQYVKKEMQKQVEGGNVTSLDRTRLLNQVGEKLEQLEVEIDDATKNNKPKKLQKLKNQREKLTERKGTLEEIKPCAPAPLKNQGQIEKLRKDLQPLLKLEKEVKGRLMSIKETAAMTRKEEIEEEIVYLENTSRGWFEEDEDFEERVEASRAKASAKAKAVKKVVKKVSGSRGGGSKQPINWVVPGSKKSAKPQARKKKASNVNAFAAMMMDSDSDSD